MEDKEYCDSPTLSTRTTSEDLGPLEMEFQSDTRFSLSVSGLNHRMISGIGDMVCILGKTHFYNMLIKNKKLIHIESVRKSEKLVS